MIPCRSHCDHYHENCHKDCAVWKELQRQNRLERQRKKAYLAYYNDLYDTIIRQCYTQMSAN
ncbi:hypothetical protein [uncultured Ruthenibacterium sp.]|uniref:hypothetical protein n=1 Tax=uncultured Ruthenibacterium sp. TaxID=1905347 RepID=UPI00349EB5CF